MSDHLNDHEMRRTALRENLKLEEAKRAGWQECFAKVVGGRRLTSLEIQLLEAVWEHGFGCGALCEMDMAEDRT